MNSFETELRELVEKHRETPDADLQEIYKSLEEVTADVYGETKSLGPFARRGPETEDI